MGMGPRDFTGRNGAVRASRLKQGTEAYVAANVAAVAFDDPMPSTAYRVACALPENTTWWVTDKTTAGFNLKLGVNITGSVDWEAIHDES
jgi:hypothetical protein